jgi:hypothetical protein
MLYRLTFYYQLLLIYHCNFVSVGDLLVQAPDEEFEEYLRHIISDQCIGDRNEVICFRKALFFFICFGEFNNVSSVLSLRLSLPESAPQGVVLLQHQPSIVPQGGVSYML